MKGSRDFGAPKETLSVYLILSQIAHSCGRVHPAPSLLPSQAHTPLLSRENQVPGLKAKPLNEMFLHYNLLLACLPNGLRWVKVLTGDRLPRVTNYIKSLFPRKTNKKQTRRKIKRKKYTRHLRTTATVTGQQSDLWVG